MLWENATYVKHAGEKKMQGDG